MKIKIAVPRRFLSHRIDNYYKLRRDARRYSEIIVKRGSVVKLIGKSYTQYVVELVSFDELLVYEQLLIEKRRK